MIFTTAVTAYGNRFHFTGPEYLPEIALYDYRNRIYSASLGRFLATDPIRFRAGDNNLYRYVRNDPLDATDPAGLGPAGAPKTPPGISTVPTKDDNADAKRNYGILINCTSMDNGDGECLALCAYIGSCGMGQANTADCIDRCGKGYAQHCK
ncbi:MAG: RHS repeat-associated core domain-containing protein [Chthoniobacterales bacterium]